MMREYKRYEEYQDSGVEWLGEVPKTWSQSKYKYYFYSSMGNTILKEDLIIDGSIPIYSATESDNIFGYVNNAKILLNKNDFVIPARGNSIGNITLVNDDKATCTQTTIYSKKVNNINGKYIYYFLDGLKEYLFSFTRTAIPQITVKQVSNNDILVPPKPEQQKIASFLDQKTAEIDEIISKKETLIDHLEKYKKSVITEAVTKGKLGDKYINEDGELVDEIEMKDSGTQFYGNIPKHLIIKKMKYITKAIIDGAHLTPTYVDDGVPFLRVTDISEGNDIDWKNTKQIPSNEHKQLKARTNPEKGDLLVSKNGTIGKTRVITWDKEFSIFVSLCLLKFAKKIDPFYIAYFFKSYALDEQIKLSGKTNTITNLHLEKIRELELLIPEQDKLQKKIVNYLDQQTTRINNLIQKTKKSIDKYKEYKKSLIFEAVTGKIDLRDYQLKGGE